MSLEKDMCGSSCDSAEPMSTVEKKMVLDCGKEFLQEWTSEKIKRFSEAIPVSMSLQVSMSGIVVSRNLRTNSSSHPLAWSKINRFPNHWAKNGFYIITKQERSQWPKIDSAWSLECLSILSWIRYNKKNIPKKNTWKHPGKFDQRLPFPRPFSCSWHSIP